MYKQFNIFNSDINGSDGNMSWRQYLFYDGTCTLLEEKGLKLYWEVFIAQLRVAFGLIIFSKWYT